ncbi:hypothetical protein MON38_21970 [Hymenobacter sp. DH14]|uniref:Uncharacterized protein n=1 Tax=Hymenobacter cyanobacteriorum TaxID=2926463 RepID=A0A9X2AHA6_9BACT|nr:hypothetical protein [Hymenobacter cyanobacteriorum]MCI1190101.1 hypothetical protein [Hymenobacter cyanobacteriorum]
MNPDDPRFLLRVAAAWPLPGLGLLALPEGPTPYLAACGLHTALAVVVRLPDGTCQPGFATVEEVSRPDDDVPTRGLLLDVAGLRELPRGTTIGLAGPGPMPA